MGVFDGLARLFRRTENRPPVMAPGFAPAGLDRADEADMIVIVKEAPIRIDRPEPPAAERRRGAPNEGLAAWREELESVGDDVFGITIAIEYRDSKGEASRRRITLRAVHEDGQGRRYLQSFCHERQAPRSFRFDRIESVIDADGVVHDPRRFFAEELRLEAFAGDAPQAPAERRRRTAAGPAPAAEPGPDVRSGDRPGMAQRRAARDGLRVLAALARSDGLLHEAELEVILDYIAGRADRAGIATAEADRLALVPYLKRQYPSGDVLEGCLAALEREPADEQRHLLRAAMALMDADGVHDSAEFEMVMSIQERLG